MKYGPYFWLNDNTAADQTAAVYDSLNKLTWISTWKIFGNQGLWLLSQVWLCKGL